jgi:glycopeptide antibiotics resistance protein
MNYRKATFIAFMGYLAFVIYGSLIPFELRELTLEQAVQRFEDIRYLDLGIGSRADWVANIVLYIPLSFLACMVLVGTRKASGLHYLTLFLVLVFGVSVAFSVEFAQLFFAPRTVSINDLIAETLGTLAGVSLWVFGRRQLYQLWDSFHKGGQQSILAVLYGYFIVYFLQSLFPFDFIISFDELSWKAAGDTYGWLFAGDCSNALRCFARLLGEGFVFAPLGLLISLAFSNLSAKRTFVAGLVIGFVIELLQFFVASGVSQGLSVLIRGIALSTGLLAGQHLKGVGVAQVAKQVSRAMPFILLPYLLFVVSLAGWFSGKWSFGQSFDEQLTPIKLMPFYYHYFSTEAVAMVSLLANAGMYAPIGLFVWAREAKRGSWQESRLMPPVILAASLALVVELGKLWLPSKHPDFTNLLIAAIAAAGVYLFARWLETILSGQHKRPAGNEVLISESMVGVEGEEPSSVVVPEKFEISPLRALCLLPVMGSLLLGLINYPLGAAILTAVLLIYGFLLWKNGAIWLFVLPLLLPILDMSERVGRLALDEFDLFILVTLLVGYARKSSSNLGNKMGGLFLPSIGLLWLSWLVSMSVAIWPRLGAEMDLLASSHSILESWMVGKGLFWALLLLPLIRSDSNGLLEQKKRFLLSGLVVGLLCLVLVVIWERLIFVGLWDFDNIFRVTGTFASMNTGGAYIEAYIAFAFPALLVWLLVQRNWGLKLLAAVAVLMVLYAMFVTYSRVGYVALAVGALVVFIGWMMRPSAVVWSKKLALFIGGAVLLLIAIVPLFSSGFAQERLARSSDDFSFRIGHWERAVSLMDDGLLTALSGMGFGQYPLNYLLYNDVEQRPTRYAVVADDKEAPYLSLIAGKTAYFEQRVDISPYENYQLTLQVRQKGGAGLKVLICEKALLYSFGCIERNIDFPANKLGWSLVDVSLNSGALADSEGGFHRPVKFSLYSSSGAVDIKGISLKTSAGVELIRNGDFSQGSNHWLFVTDQDLAWHIHEQWVELYFAQGLLGVVALLILLLVVMRALLSKGEAAEPLVIALFSGLLALLTVGLLGSVMDSARISLLIYLGCFLGVKLFERDQ